MVFARARLLRFGAAWTAPAAGLLGAGLLLGRGRADAEGSKESHGHLCQIVKGKNGMEKVLLRHANGSSAEVYLFGATTTSYQDKTGTDILFVSEKAIFDQKKAIRGGIPVVFPHFGPGFIPGQHGFARNLPWKPVTLTADAAGPKAILELTDADVPPATRALWPYAFKVQLHVQVKDDELVTAIDIENKDDRPFEFQTLLHTYLALQGDISEARVLGLSGSKYSERGSGRELTFKDPTLRINKEHDTMYLAQRDPLVVATGKGRLVKILKSAQLVKPTGSNRRMIPDVVVWNPWEEKASKLADFRTEEFHKMLCVEPGLVRKFYRPRPHR